MSMTMTAPVTTTVRARTKPHEDAVLAKIQEETGCSLDEARSWLHWLKSTLGQIRVSTGAVHYLTIREMERRHRILDIIVPDDTVAQPGSGTAHDLVQRYVLDDARDEVALTHTKREVENRTYCSILVGVLSIS